MSYPGFISARQYYEQRKRRKIPMRFLGPPRRVRRRGKRKLISPSSKDMVKSITVEVGTPIGFAVASTNTNDDFVLLNKIQQGDGVNQRIGNRVRLKSVRIYGQITHIYRPVVTTLNCLGNSVRFILLWDKSPNEATTPVFNAIFGGTDGASATSTDYMDAILINKFDRYQILREWTIDCNIEAYLTGGSEDECINVKTIDYYVDLKGKEVVYTGTADPITIGNVTNGALYIIARSFLNTADVSQIQCEATLKARLRYVD